MSDQQQAAPGAKQALLVNALGKEVGAVVAQLLADQTELLQEEQSKANAELMTTLCTMMAQMEALGQGVQKRSSRGAKTSGAPAGKKMVAAGKGDACLFATSHSSSMRYFYAKWCLANLMYRCTEEGKTADSRLGSIGEFIDEWKDHITALKEALISGEEVDDQLYGCFKEVANVLTVDACIAFTIETKDWQNINCAEFLAELDQNDLNTLSKKSDPVVKLRGEATIYRKRQTAVTKEMVKAEWEAWKKTCNLAHTKPELEADAAPVVIN